MGYLSSHWAVLWKLMGFAEIELSLRYSVNAFSRDSRKSGECAGHIFWSLENCALISKHRKLSLLGKSSRNFLCLGWCFSWWSACCTSLKTRIKTQALSLHLQSCHVWLHSGIHGAHCLTGPVILASFKFSEGPHLRIQTSISMQTYVPTYKQDHISYTCTNKTN